MEKTTRLFLGRSGTLESLLRALANQAANFIKWGEALGFKSETMVTGLGLAFIALVGGLHLMSPSRLNFEFFYLLGCALVGWAAGIRGVLVCTLASATVLGFIELRGATNPLSLWIFSWNSAVRLGAFLASGWLAARAGKLTRGLEQTVAHRTARLQHEVTEHKQTAELLREAMQLFKQVAENITGVFWATDPLKTRVEYVSPAFESVWGEACSTLYRNPGTWLERIHQEDRARVTQAAFTKQVTGEFDEEFRVVRPDGSERWVHDRAFPVKDENAAVYRLVGIAEDITERKRAERLVQSQRDLGLALGSTNNLQFALELLLDIALQLEGIDCGGVYLLDRESAELHLAAHRHLSGAFLKRISHYPADAAETRLAKAGRNEYLRRERIPRSLEVLWGSEGLRALAMVPVQHKGAVLGLLNLGSYRLDEIAPRTRVAIEMIASQVAGAIARIRAEDALRRSEAHVRTIVNSAPIALLATDAQGVITFAEGQSLSELGVRPSEHLRQSITEVYRDFPAMQENARRALAGEQFSSLIEFSSSVFDCRYTPLRGKGTKPSGFIMVAADVTERVRLQRQLLEISDREQARLGQDVHDGLCQQLIGTALKANSLEHALSSQQYPEASAARKICALLDEAITESRRVCRGLYPVRLTTEGLVPALEELAQGVRERYQVQCDCQIEAPQLHCNLAVATHLYRIAQEAVNNALKHSRARQICIRLTEANGALELSVQDNGSGFKEGAASGKGMGLHIMDYRARSLGGTLRLTGGAGGTVVTCAVPELQQGIGS